MFGFAFFFSSRRRHTRLVSDWSSDVCSSDLKTNIENRRINPTFFLSTVLGDICCQTVFERLLVHLGKVSENFFGLQFRGRTVTRPSIASDASFRRLRSIWRILDCRFYFLLPSSLVFSCRR